MITACLLKILIRGTCLVVQWLGLCASTSENMGLIPGWGTKIPHAPWHSQKKKKKEIMMKKISEIYMAVTTALFTVTVNTKE